MQRTFYACKKKNIHSIVLAVAGDAMLALGGIMRACVIKSAGHIAIEQWPETPLGKDEVRLDFAWGGICGSDLHYYQHGRVANSIVREPMILGHEFSGIVCEAGDDVTGLSIGQPVVVNPSRPCNTCDQCGSGLTHLCRSMRYMGSAAHQPHTNGGFSERPVVLASQCRFLPKGFDLAVASLCEPFAVALHAVALGEIPPGATVLVTGAGTIGSLVAVAARNAGAGRLIVTDIAEPALTRIAKVTGAETFQVGSAELSAEAEAVIGEVDVTLECAGSANALDMAIRLTRPRGKIVQVGFLPPAAPLSLAGLLTREISLVGAYRFLEEFDLAVEQITTNAVDLSSFITGRYSMGQVEEAFVAAADRSRNVKVLLHFDT
ncbi:L-idonate 5-dehydrogenase [Ciceribacter sp. L1K22]|uniref:L-idonate 5-dehydrogenase n=1 Tax=Ciceribacter sp. L1K22 TaxID=2820275 RepID=UPI001ABDE67C|nr:L-idonate 5-dehydrogenase [Ciceribacter sp. L1K22]MBO3761635.1 L-idonate 5-dehydrogenase [Ciceribacter sp. L1K22]